MLFLDRNACDKAEQTPEGAEWLYELKLGYRAIGFKTDADVLLHVLGSNSIASSQINAHCWFADLLARRATSMVELSRRDGVGKQISDSLVSIRIYSSTKKVKSRKPPTGHFDSLGGILCRGA